MVAYSHESIQSVFCGPGFVEGVVMFTAHVRLQQLLDRNQHFTFDLRAECRVYSGVVAAYRPPFSSGFTDLMNALSHAYAHDSILMVSVRLDGNLRYDSCRLFTDEASALFFAQREQQHTVFNLNRSLEVHTKEPGPSHGTEHEVLQFPIRS